MLKSILLILKMVKNMSIQGLGQHNDEYPFNEIARIQNDGEYLPFMERLSQRIKESGGAPQLINKAVAAVDILPQPQELSLDRIKAEVLSCIARSLAMSILSQPSTDQDDASRINRACEITQTIEHYLERSKAGETIDNVLASLDRNRAFAIVSHIPNEGLRDAFLAQLGAPPL